MATISSLRSLLVSFSLGMVLTYMYTLEHQKARTPSFIEVNTAADQLIEIINPLETHGSIKIVLCLKPNDGEKSGSFQKHLSLNFNHFGTC